MPRLPKCVHNLALRCREPRLGRDYPSPRLTRLGKEVGQMSRIPHRSQLEMWPLGGGFQPLAKAELLLHIDNRRNHRQPTLYQTGKGLV